MNKKIWATLGPSSLNADVIYQIKEYVSVFRLNLSHVEKSENDIKLIQSVCSVPICLDMDCGKYGELHKLNHRIESYGITGEDIDHLNIGKKYGCEFIALSFARDDSDVLWLRSMYPKQKIISKIESKPGLDNIDAIEKVSDFLLIDRGDLSRSVSIEKIPQIQHVILQSFKNVYVATNMMDVLSNTGKPSTGEVNDVWATLQSGAAGIVLAGETAIGSHPVESVEMIWRIIREFEKH